MWPSVGKTISSQYGWPREDEGSTCLFYTDNQEICLKSGAIFNQEGAVLLVGVSKGAIKNSEYQFESLNGFWGGRDGG